MNDDDMLPKDIPPLLPLHTLQTDTAETLTKENVSTTHIIAEQEKAKEIKTREAEKNASEFGDVASRPRSSHLLRNSLITLVMIVVMSGAGYAIFSTTFEKEDQGNTPVMTKVGESKGLLSNNSEKEIIFSTDELLNRQGVSSKLLNDARVEENELTQYKLNVSLDTLLVILSPSIPSDYRRSFNEKSFFGSIDEENFFIIGVDSYEQAYAGQLEWEKTMKEDLFPLFGISSSSTLIRFEDRIVGNKDARVATNANGTTLFLYGFHQQDTLIFAKNEDTFRSISEMLLRQNL